MLLTPSLYLEKMRPVPDGICLRPAIFLDRDGVVTDDPGYLHRPGDLRLLPGAAEAIRRFNSAEVPVVIVTNQSGIGRGYFGWDDFERVQERLRLELARQGASIDAEVAAGYIENSKVPFETGAEWYRKPNPGMLERAAAELRLNLADSWMAGDKVSDIEAGMRSGIAGVVHVLTGHGRSARPEVEAMARCNTTACRIILADSIAELPAIIGAGSGIKAG